VAVRRVKAASNFSLSIVYDFDPRRKKEKKIEGKKKKMEKTLNSAV